MIDYCSIDFAVQSVEKNQAVAVAGGFEDIDYIIIIRSSLMACDTDNIRLWGILLLRLLTTPVSSPCTVR